MDAQIQKMLTSHVLTVREAAKMTGYTYQTLMIHISKGSLPAHKTGNTRCVYRADLDRWLEQRKRKPKKDYEEPEEAAPAEETPTETTPPMRQ